MTYGGKSTVRDRSSGTSSSVAFTPLQVKRSQTIPSECLLSTMFCFLVDNCFVVICRGWKLWIRRLQRKRWLKPTRNTFPTWQSSLKSRRKLRCEHTHTQRASPYTVCGQLHQHCTDGIISDLSEHYSSFPVFSFEDFCFFYFNKMWKFQENMLSWYEFVYINHLLTVIGSKLVLISGYGTYQTLPILATFKYKNRQC